MLGAWKQEVTIQQCTGVTPMRRLIEEYFDAWEEGTPERVLPYFSEDVVINLRSQATKLVGGQRCGSCVMEQRQIEILGKVFLVVGGNRKCLICDAIFEPRKASEHAAILWINASREQVSRNSGSSFD